MARAYDHLPIFRRFVDFTLQRRHELESSRSDLISELKMLEEVEAAQLVCPLNLVAYLTARRIAIEKQYEELAVETTVWTQIQASLPFCFRCYGRGELLEIIAQDESRYYKCAACSGSGKRPEVSA